MRDKIGYTKAFVVALGFIMSWMITAGYAYAQQSDSGIYNLSGFYDPNFTNCHGDDEDTLQYTPPGQLQTNFLIPKGSSFTFENFDVVADGSVDYYIRNGKIFYTYANATITVNLSEFDGSEQQTFELKLDAEGKGDITVHPDIVMHGSNIICVFPVVTPYYPPPIGTNQPIAATFMKFYAAGTLSSTTSPTSTSPDQGVSGLLNAGVKNVENTSQNNWNAAQQSIDASNQTYEQKEAAISSNIAALQNQLQEQQPAEIASPADPNGSAATNGQSSWQWVDLHSDERSCIGTKFTTSDLTFTNNCGTPVEILWSVTMATDVTKVILQPGQSGNGTLPCFGTGCSQFSSSVTYAACPFNYIWTEAIVNSGADPTGGDSWNPASGASYQCMRREQVQ